MKKKLILTLTLLCIAINSCGIYRPVDQRTFPGTAKEKAKKNIEEGRGVSVNNLLKRGSSGFEFNTSNPLWRASLELIDFMPLTTVDYSGGIIITDWYNDNNKNNEYIKITLRFLNNEIDANSVKIIVHQKKCSNSNNCVVNEIKSKIKDDLLREILTNAAKIKLEQDKK